MDLFWSRHGSVACALHAPTADSDRWQKEVWQQVPAWRQAVTAGVLQCQFCHGRPYERHPRYTSGQVKGEELFEPE